MLKPKIIHGLALLQQRQICNRSNKNNVILVSIFMVGNSYFANCVMLEENVCSTRNGALINTELREMCCLFRETRERRANEDRHFEKMYRQEWVESDWDNRDINPHIPEGHSCVQDVHLAGWLGCGSAHPAGLHIADRCLASQACSATGTVCSRKTRRTDAATWCPTRLLLGFTGHAPVAITWPQIGFWNYVPSIMFDDRVEQSLNWKTA